jgi:hypothetical protein
MAPSRCAAEPASAPGHPLASTLREEVFEEDRRGARVDVARAAQLRLGGRVSLVVEPHGEPELFGRRRETPDPLGLVAFLAAQGQRQTDDQGVDRLFAGDPLDLRQILDDASSNKGPKGSRETVRVIANGEADTAVAYIERQIAHPLR